MAKSPQDATDKGYRDGQRERRNEEQSGVFVNEIQKIIGGSTYDPDKNFPETYKDAYEQGKKGR